MRARLLGAKLPVLSRRLTLPLTLAGDSEAVLDRDGEPLLLAEAARHKPDEARELARIRSKVWSAC